jgi:hypothetical protein
MTSLQVLKFSRPLYMLKLLGLSALSIFELRTNLLQNFVLVIGSTWWMKILCGYTYPSVNSMPQHTDPYYTKFNSGFSGFFSVSPGYFRVNTSIRPWLLSSVFFQIYCYTIYLLRASLKDTQNISSRMEWALQFEKIWGKYMCICSKKLIVRVLIAVVIMRSRTFSISSLCGSVSNMYENAIHGIGIALD